MLPLLTLAGLALVATLLPDSSDGNEGPETASGDLSASSPKSTEDGDENSPLSYASKTAERADDTLAATGDADSDAGPDVQTQIGSDTGDMLYGDEGDDAMWGATGSDYMDGGEGDDWLFGDDDAEGDEMLGGDGHDTFQMGSGDWATGGSGDDRFFLDESADKAAVITDFSPDDDTVAVYYDPTGPEPTLETEQTEEGVNLWANGDLIAIFRGAKLDDLAEIHLVPEAQAA